MKISKIGSLFGKLLLAMLAFPPIYIVLKYLGWCNKREKEESVEKEEEN